MKRHLASFLVPFLLISLASQGQDFLYTRENPIPINLSSGSFQNTHPVPGEIRDTSGINSAFLFSAR